MKGRVISRSGSLTPRKIGSEIREPERIKKFSKRTLPMTKYFSYHHHYPSATSHFTDKGGVA